MTGDGNKKGYNNKILIRTLMLASMVCILSVSDMLGMEPKGTQIDPYDAMKKINKNKKTSEAFMKIFEGHENLIKRNCCGCCIDIENTMLPKKGEENNDKVDNHLANYIRNRFILTEEGNVEINGYFPKNAATCDDLDELIKGTYKAPSK